MKVRILLILIPSHCVLYLNLSCLIDDKQRSLYLKIAVFRWINTALVAKISASFTQNLGSQNTDIIPAMNGIMFSEIYLPPLLNFLDIMGNLSKHYFAPRARTLQQMLLCFKGTPYHLAEKYTVCPPRITQIFTSFSYSNIFFSGRVQNSLCGLLLLGNKSGLVIHECYCSHY